MSGSSGNTDRSDSSDRTTPAQRAQRLTEVRNLKMARSAHAYVRGSHVGNLGPLADAKGRVAVQIRDLDQTVTGNPVHDLIGLGLSLASPARGSNLPGIVTARILEHLIAGYEAGLAGDFAGDRDKSHRPDSIQLLLSQSVRRRGHHLAMDRLDTIKPELPLGKRFWSLTRQERSAMRKLFATEATRRMITDLQSRDSDDPVEMIDAAYWMKGCSSLGRVRYAMMLRVGKGKNSALCLVDVKEGVSAAAPRNVKVTMPRDNAIRVVTGAKALSPNLGQRMLAGRLLDVGVVLRELMPQDLKIEIDRLTQEEATALAGYLAGIVGRAHGRRMDISAREAWRSELSKARPSNLDAPSWLWASVIELLSIHEAAYLEHCRRFAFAEAA